MMQFNTVGSVGAGLSQAQFQVAFQTRALKEQQDVVMDLASAALKLIHDAMGLELTPEHDLDVKA